MEVVTMGNGFPKSRRQLSGTESFVNSKITELEKQGYQLESRGRRQSKGNPEKIYFVALMEK